jgi:hypothetical protein
LPLVSFANKVKYFKIWYEKNKDYDKEIISKSGWRVLKVVFRLMLKGLSLRTLFFIFVFSFMGLVPAYADEIATPKHVEDIKKDSRIGKRVRVFMRGIVNIVTLPLEVPRTFFEEKKRNPENWEWSLVPRTLENVVGRGLSAVNDSVLSPFLKNSDDLENPWSRQWGLPDYAWTKKNYKMRENKSKQEGVYTMIGVRG